MVDAVRRSKRQKVEPLDFWRNERLVYTRTSLKEVVRVPAPPTPARPKKSQRSTTHAKEVQPKVNPVVVVKEYLNDSEVERSKSLSSKESVGLVLMFGRLGGHPRQHHTTRSGQRLVQVPKSV
jgi:hypothetical protein